MDLAPALRGAEDLRKVLRVPLVADADLENEAQALAERMTAQPTYALAMAKKMFQFSLSPPLDHFLEYEALMQPQIHQTQDYREGIAAFKDKRPAKFVGR